MLNRHNYLIMEPLSLVMGQTTREKLVELIDNDGMGSYIAHALIRRMTTDECRDFLADLKAGRV